MKKINLIVVLLLIVMSCKDDKKVESQSIDIGDFSFSSKDIVANEPFNITYNGNDVLDESFYYELRKSNAYPLDINFEKKTATITVPDSISAVAFNFKVGSDYANNNEKGYLFSVVDKDGNLAADTEASKQYYAFSHGEDYGVISNEEATLLAVENAIEKQPDLTMDWLTIHTHLARLVNPEKGKEVNANYLLMLSSKKEMSLKDFEALANIYNAMKDKERLDSLSKVVSEQYPNSNLGTRLIINDFFEAKDLSTKESIFTTHKENILKSRNASYVLNNLALSYFKKGDQDAFDATVKMIESKTDEASLYNQIAWPQAEKGEDIEWATQLSGKSLELIKEEQQSLKHKPNYYSLNQYKKSLVSTYAMYADTYGLLLFKKGDLKDAIKYQAIAVDKGTNAEINERYIQFLIADKQYKTVAEKASKFIEEGNSTAKIKSDYIEAVKKADSTQDAEMMLAELEEKAKVKEIENLKKTILDEDAPDFTLKNLDGKEVSLSSLKGKIVILDFWATWCAPCIASFPGMQTAVTKYKDDDNVAFLFIDTFEGGKDRLDKVSKFIKDSNYDFHVLIDPMDEGKGKYTVANDYKVSGIPTKVIIGPSGRINFRSVGFSGSTEKVVSEIEAMITLLK